MSANLPAYHYVARLKKKDPSIVLCGYATCEGEIGIRLESDIPGNPLRLLVLPVGWWRDERKVWRLSPSARAKKRHNGAERMRTHFFNRGRELDNRFSPTRVHVFPDLPAVAVCPVCHHPNLLDAETLGVLPWSLDLPLP